MSVDSINWDAPWTVLACRVLFRERGERLRGVELRVSRGEG